MKKSCVYLIIALMLATMLCGCGMDADDGVIGTSPRPTDTITTSPNVLPDVSPTIIPDNGTASNNGTAADNGIGTDTDTGRKSPQVGETDSAKTSPNVTDNNY